MHMGTFSGYPLVRWQGDRLMILQEEFYFIDDDGKKWEVPIEAELNGATIPKFLWSTIGPPYVGSYRRASVVHDFFVGEGNNPDVTYPERRKADKMFYQACRADGCSIWEATKLYIGVSIGSWTSKKKSRTDGDFKSFALEPVQIQVSEEDKFNQILEKLGEQPDGDFSLLEKLVEAELS